MKTAKMHAAALRRAMHALCAAETTNTRCPVCPEIAAAANFIEWQAERINKLEDLTVGYGI